MTLNSLVNTQEEGSYDLFADHEEIPAAGRIYHGKIGRFVSPLHRIGRLWKRQTKNPRSLERARELVPAILASLPATPEPDVADLTILNAKWTITDVAVFGVGPKGSDPIAFVKIPETREGAANLRRQEMVLSALHADARLGDWRSLVPLPWAGGEIAGRAYLVEYAVPGVELRSLRTSDAEFHSGIAGAAFAIGELHRQTVAAREVDSLLLERWIDRPLSLMSRLSAVLPGPARFGDAADQLGSELRSALEGRTLELGWIHGDFWTSNVLVALDGTVTGIVDWERAAPDEPAFHDLLQLVLHSPRLEAAHRDLGAVVRWLLAGGTLVEDEWALLGSAHPPFSANEEGLRLMLLLYWLRYVATYLAKVPDQARNPWWVRRNIGDVLLAAIQYE
jgi:aminoglycoside phosphotransferase